MQTSPFSAGIALGQGLYNLVTGIWPWVSIRTFMMVTGPKTDLWLVKTVGALVAAIGGVLTAAGRRKQVDPQLRAVAVGTALSLAAVDVIFVAQKRISPIYLLDAAAELGIVALWTIAQRADQQTTAERGNGAAQRPSIHI